MKAIKRDGTKQVCNKNGHSRSKMNMSGLPVGFMQASSPHDGWSPILDYYNAGCQQKYRDFQYKPEKAECEC